MARADHVHLRRRSHACGAPDEERERDLDPELKFVTTKSSIEIAKQSRSAARIAGAIAAA